MEYNTNILKFSGEMRNEILATPFVGRSALDINYRKLHGQEEIRNSCLFS